MPSLNELVDAHTALDVADVAWLQLLMADWQIIADLSFADLVLWLPDREGEGFWAAGQMRPTTGPTAFVDDVIGAFVPAGGRPLLDLALAERRVVREGDPEWRDDVPVRVEAIPVRRGDRVVAVITRNTNLTGIRTASRLELAYLQTASDLMQMITAGHFPILAERGDHADSPRVGDGFLRLDAAGRVAYASPNALSVYRRLGSTADLEGAALADLTRSLVPPRLRADEETLSAVFAGRASRDTEIATDQVALVARSIPLWPAGERIGALVLVRDVTDLRRRDRELVTKDTTIREIHHRVKNNLQTVAALLRLQARRITDPVSRDALEEAVRRVGSIAIVHETLSRANLERASGDMVDFDEVHDRLSRMVLEVSAQSVSGPSDSGPSDGGPSDSGQPDRLRIRREGSFGELGSDVATALAIVLTELLQNAVQHGYDAHTSASGTITARVRRGAGELRVAIVDDGAGLPAGFDLARSNLGLSIVRTLVETELGGRLAIGPRRRSPGTRAEITIPLG